MQLVIGEQISTYNVVKQTRLRSQYTYSHNFQLIFDSSYTVGDDWTLNALDLLDYFFKSEILNMRIKNRHECHKSKF